MTGAGAGGSGGVVRGRGRPRNDSLLRRASTGTISGGNNANSVKKQQQFKVPQVRDATSEILCEISIFFILIVCILTENSSMFSLCIILNCYAGYDSNSRYRILLLLYF